MLQISWECVDGELYGEIGAYSASAPVPRGWGMLGLLHAAEKVRARVYLACMSDLSDARETVAAASAVRDALSAAP